MTLCVYFVAVAWWVVGGACVCLLGNVAARCGGTRTIALDVMQLAREEAVHQLEGDAVVRHLADVKGEEACAAPRRLKKEEATRGGGGGM